MNASGHTIVKWNGGTDAKMLMVFPQPFVIMKGTPSREGYKRMGKSHQ